MRHLLLSLTFLIPLSASAGGDTEALRTLLDEFLAGASVNDAAMHDRFWAEDLVYTSSDGERFGKAEIMAGLEETDDAAEPSKAEASKEEAPNYSARDVNIRSFGETAVVTFRLVAELEDQSRTEYFNTGVFRSREGQWQAVAWQATRIGAQDE